MRGNQRRYRDAEDEYEACDMIEQDFREWGWDVEREVWSDCHSFRADFIISHSNTGRFGIEVKDLTSGFGRLIGEAIRQIAFQYRGKCFDGEPVTRWCFLPILTGDQNGTKRDASLNIMKEVGIGFIEIASFEKSIKWGPSNYADRRFSLKSPRGVRQSTLDEIDEYIEEKSGDLAEDVPEIGDEVFQGE